MLNKNFIMAIAAGFAMVACAEKFDEPGILPAGSDNVHTLSVGIEAGTYTPAEGATKASMEAVIRVNWTEGDEVSVVNATKEKILGGCLKAQASGVSVTFEGTVAGTIEENDVLYYIYPRLADNTEEIAFDNAGYNQTLAKQTYNNETPGKVCFYGYAEDVAGTVTISKKIQFNLVTAYAHLNMSNLPAKGAPLTGIDISNVNEGFTWKLSETNLTAEPYAGNNGISVTCTNCNITQAGNAVARFAIPASAASQQAREITVNKAYKNDGYTVKELEKASYHNQLYSTWENNVKVTSQGDKTKVDITTSEGSTDVAEGVIPVAEAFNGTKPTEIGIGGVGTVTFDATATAKIKSNANEEGSTNVFFKVEDVTNDTDVQNKNIVYEVTMKTVDEKGVEVFKEGKAEGVATVTVPLGEEVVSVESVSLVDENGQKISGGVVDNSWHIEKGILTFQVNHFSKYAIQYTLKETQDDYVAQIGNSKYTTLKRAIDAVQNGNTIKLLCDCNEGEGIVVEGGKNFTLDFGGHTYKVTKDLAGSTGTKNQCFQLLKGSTLVFQNGTITTSCAKLGINSYSDLILKDVTVDMSQTSATDAQIVCLQTCNGNTSLQGNTNLIAKENRLAILALYWPNAYGDINVELNTTGEVKGLMAYGSYQVQDLSTVAQHSHVAIKNGKYDVTFDMDNLDNYDFKIYGGVFKTSPDTKYLAPNHEVVTNTDPETSGTYPCTVQQKPYVAQIGDTKYFTLADAVAAVPANTQTTITMVNDFATTEKVTIAAAQNIVLELNGKKISYTTDGYGSFIENRGQLKIKDSGSTGIITAEFSAPNWNNGCYTIDNFGASTASILVIESGTIENTSPSGLAWPINNGSYGTSADLVINGGTIHSTNYVPVREYLQCGGKKTVVINGGKFISDNSRAIAVQVNDATIEDIGSSVTINGGEFTCKGSGILYVDMHAANTDLTGFTMTVNGGQFKNTDAGAPVLVYDYEGKDHDSAVLLSKILKGGIYSKEPAQELVAFGYRIEDNTDTQTSSAYPWRVAANSAEGAEVSISKPGQTTVYSTLAAFRDATNEGETFAGYTVTLLKDIDLTNDDWTPIGTTDYYNYFSGVFDGNNHLITLNKSEIPGDFGFFNLLVGDSEDTPAIVENLNLKVNLSSKQSTRTWVGGVTDMAYGYVLFENIVVTGSITSGGYAGGIVGYSSQNDSDWGSKVIYKNCTNKANINIVGKGEYTCLGGIAAQTGSNLDCFINCKNEGILTSDHTNISTAASYMGHMVGKGTYGKNISFSGCSFSESATINGWNVYNSEVSSYPFEGYMTPSQTYTYGTGTPNLGKQMVGGYFGTCTLDGVQQNFTYPNGNSDDE